MLRKRDAAVTGIARADRITKRLIPRLQVKDIAVIAHRDLDEIAASALLECKVAAIVNANRTMSGDYPTKGASMLLAGGVPIYEIAPADFERIRSGMRLRIEGTGIVCEHDRIACRAFTWTEWKEAEQEAEGHLHERLDHFIENTLAYAHKEKEAFIGKLDYPQIATSIRGRHVLIVVRGSGFRQDLAAIHDYIEDYEPVLIGVDGGADALLRCGYEPALIVGDMDSVSDEALRSGAEILVHAYPDGRAPGLERTRQLGLAASTIAAPGISEDIAMLLAYEHDAEMIVTLGTHTHMIDFLEKGRKGMASTMLVRMKIGSKLVDAKGVSKLYHRKTKWRSLWFIPAAGLFPLVMLGFIHPGFRQTMAMIWLYMKLSVSS